MPQCPPNHPSKHPYTIVLLNHSLTQFELRSLASHWTLSVLLVITSKIPCYDHYSAHLVHSLITWHCINDLRIPLMCTYRMFTYEFPDSPTRSSTWLDFISGDVVVQWLHRIFCVAWGNGTVPADWRKAQIVPVHKKGSRTQCKNYREISLLSVPGKV